MYNLVKKNYIFETNFTEIKNLKHRTTVTKILTPAHRLPIETGRNTEKYKDQNENVNFVTMTKLVTNFIISCSNPHFIALMEGFMKD